MTTQKEVAEHVAALNENIGGLRDEVTDLRKNEDWRKKAMHRLVVTGRVLIALAIVDVAALVAVVSVAISSSHSLQTLRSFTDPQSCLIIFSQHSTRVQDWVRIRNNALLHPVEAKKVYPPDGVPDRPPIPPVLDDGGRCHPIYQNYFSSLPK